MDRRLLAAAASITLVLGLTPGAPPATAARTTSKSAPVIVIDPGHSPGKKARDKKTGLIVSDYENEPEMRDMWAVAKLVRAKLRKDGYRVVFTRRSLRQRTTLAKRADVANRVHADLALSIHDQAGRHGGIGFRKGNNIVYYQAVGKYRSTPSGKRIVFRNKKLARTSKRFGKNFAAERRAVQHVRVKLQDDVGYNLGSRGLAPGNMWIVQLLSRVPWIYNEAGGNSKGRTGLSAHDKRVYANSLVAAVERCVPIRR